MPNENTPKYVTMDANEAVASVSHRLSEVIAIYPITPSSPMAESADEWSAAGRKNIWGHVPRVAQLQSEAGVAGAVHGSLLGGSLTTTYTASQGLLLMIPVMYKIAGELIPFTMHVSARALATNALSIFGDHSDVMACRATGFAMLCSGSGQEANDLALIAHAASLEGSLPFLHFFDGFRTSHEVSKINTLSDAVLSAMIDPEKIREFRTRALNPDAPSIRGVAANPDVYFQSREACNAHYLALPAIVQNCMDRFASITGRHYHLFDYCGAPDADRLIVAMGSACETISETIDHLNARGEKLGLLKVRLFLPFDTQAFLNAIPRTVKTIAVLDRTKEPGSLGEPLYQNVITAVAQDNTRSPAPRVIGGRYGLGSKEFTPAMIKAIYDELARPSPKNGFTIGIYDDVSNTSIPFDPEWDIEQDDVVRAVFVGLGADGTVGANKNSIKIIGEQTDNFAQGYFVYDSKKSGALTVSHLRFGPRPIRSQYLISQANFVSCSQYSFIGRHAVLEFARPRATVLLNSPFSPEETWRRLPVEWQRQAIEKELSIYTIDATRVARDSGMGGRTNTVMQTCFFALSGVLPRDEAIAQIKKSIKKTYSRKGDEVIQKNYQAVDNSLAALHKISLPDAPDADAAPIIPPVYQGAPDFVKSVTARIIAGQGDLLPVSALPASGTWPAGTTKYEKRNLADSIPEWEPSLCIQCNKCVTVCPHAAIRAKYYPESALADPPQSFKSTPFKSKDNPASRFTIQVAPEDCTGCTLCAQVCPAKDRKTPGRKALNMAPQAPLRIAENANFDYFLNHIPDPPRTRMGNDMKSVQFMPPLIEFSGACTGCGETPYIKLLTQLFGDRLYMANATGCSSIYGGNLPTTPYTTNAEGRGPAWANSLFEDNAEFGYGMRLAVDEQTAEARELLVALKPAINDDALIDAILSNPQKDETAIATQRTYVASLRQKLASLPPSSAQIATRLAERVEFLVKKTVWIVGGDGWAYDIGYGGVDHVLATGANIKILVLDTEVYSNTGGQASKSTPTGAIAKFAASGKRAPKKDLAGIAMQYGNVYVARVAIGARDAQLLNALREAESFDGPALIIAYSHCIAHGYDIAAGLNHQELAVKSGYWSLLRYNPDLAEQGVSPLKLDSPKPSADVADFMASETRFKALERIDPALASVLRDEARAQALAYHAKYEALSKLNQDKVAQTTSPPA
ncbi:MAG: pyruvate:ferredoxin (flavodoxin) oxidoreductase [Puniceicoccales bacterium]|nr:pyruvate:ferredoxin (flavodoxin) oxidoreductase [Puniceicoccales bacterium]